MSNDHHQHELGLTFPLTIYLHRIDRNIPYAQRSDRSHTGL